MLPARKAVYIIFFMLQTLASAQNKDSVLKHKIDTLILKEMKKAKVVGVAIGIVKDGKVWYTKGYGSKAVKTNQPIDSLTNFHLASVSKLFVAMAIMQLVEHRKLSLDAKLMDYINLEKPKDSRYASVTIRQLLTHSSGIADTDDYDWNKPKYDSLALGNYCKRYIETKKTPLRPRKQI